MKKIIFTILAATFALTAAFSLSSADVQAASVIVGDLNADGQVNSDDAIFLLMHSQFPDDPDYALNQEIKFKKGDTISSDDAIYLLMYTQFPDEYPIDVSYKKMKYESIGAYKVADASSEKVSDVTYGNTYTITKKTSDSYMEWSYVKEVSGWVPSSVFVSSDTELPETYTYTREQIVPYCVSDTVKKMQEAMNALGYRDSEGNKLAVDGIYEDKSIYAVKLFQEDYDFGPDGYASPTGWTWTKIDSIDVAGYGVTFTSATTTYYNHSYQAGSVSADREGLAVHTTPAGWTYVKDVDAWVKSDAYVDRVSLTPYRNDAYTPHTINIVKSKLNSYGFYGQSGSDLTLNGIYDDDFYYALCNFQEAVGLNRVGDMPYNGKTWSNLQNYNPVNVDFPHLYIGMTSDYKTQMMPYISMLNRFLNQIGYSAEKTNIAYWTNATVSAVKAFQTDYDLGADGYVGNGTWKTLVKKVITNDTTSDSSFEAELTAQGFPESYKVYLRRLHKLHPNWKFVAESAAHDWSTFVGYQSFNDGNQPVSLMSKTWASCLWNSNYSGQTYDGGAWVVPNTETIQYYMDPRNFLDETNAFEFFDLTYSDIYTEEFVSEIASSLGLAYMSGTYTHANGTTINYPAVIVAACKQYNYNPAAFLASVKQEIGTSPEENMITGTFSGYEGYYNYVNYGAYQEGSMGPQERGMWAAKQKEWNTREKAIYGAIAHFAENYVQTGQNTIYYKKFNAKSSVSKAYHQYMSNISGAYSEGFNMGSVLYSKLSDAEITFKIPVYSGMQGVNYFLPDQN